ncbi:uncharacterized protein PAC_00693 [Phialocephala subalpina]|uniref:DUF2406 domain protein n=1 Tax=Phialocephala subalpina TaxID=576137 RepID=A0A1L7WDN8_9HELO|nr:uncharacterized protein PAC_00693 [Phialocephala subalpina]
MSANHPLPAAPGQQHFEQQRPAQRQRAKSSFSFHSHKSSGSGHKIDLHETHAEKESRRLGNSKADPSMALTESEPSAVASGVKSSLASIRAIQHRDNQGNPIADPDRSNPTRSRWERPLDTIRAFEAAIDGNYNRKSFMRTDPGDGQSNYNRRSSYYGGTQITTDERPRFPQNGSYGGRSQSYRPDSYAQRPDSYYNGPENAGPQNGYTPNRARYPRTASEPHFNNPPGVYPVPGNQQSYETVNTASGSGSSGDPAGYSTDPSSENSSVDRITPLPVKEPGETYGFNGFGATPQYSLPGAGLQEQYVASPANGAQRQGNGYQKEGAPAVLRKDSALPRVPIKLSATSGNAGPPNNSQRPSSGEKRKSWFGKRFSKS